MERIRTADLAGIDPVTGKNIFVERLLPQIGTRQRDYWFNAVQEELSNAIELSGLPLNPSDNTQLLQAMKRPHAITANTTFNVNPAGGADFTTIQAALDSLVGRYILPGVTVTIQLSSSDHLISSNIRVRHPQGNQILIRGSANLAGANPYRLRIQASFAAGQLRSAFFADKGEYIRVQGVRIWGPIDPDNLSYAAYAYNYGQIYFTDCVIEEIYGIGVFSTDNGHVGITNTKVQSIYPLSDTNFGYGLYLRDFGSIHTFSLDLDNVQAYAVYAEGYCKVRVQNSIIKKGSIYAERDCLVELFENSFPLNMGGVLVQYGCKLFVSDVSYSAIGNFTIKDSYAWFRSLSMTNGFIVLAGSKVDASGCDIAYSGSSFAAWNLGRFSSVRFGSNTIRNTAKGFILESISSVEGTTTFISVPAQYTKFVPGDVTAITP